MAPVGGGFALPHPSARITLGRDSGTVALLLLRDALPPDEASPDGVPITRLLFFFIAPSPRAHLDLLGRLSRSLARGPLRELVVKGATDEEIFQAVDAVDAASGGRTQTGGEVMTPGPLLLFAFVALVAGIVVGARLSRTWLALTVAGTVAGLSAALMVLLGAPDWEWRSGFSLGGELVHLRLDGVSALFLVLLCVVGGAGAVYAREYWSEHHYPASAPRGRAWWSALVLSMGLVLTVSNGLHFLIAWELFAICGYFLITLDGAAARSARGRLAVSGGVARGHGLPLRLLRHAGGAHRKLGPRPDARAARSWHRCSGWRWPVSA